MEGPGTIIDCYKLLEKIGEGGFGVVFKADQIEPIRRRVAMKIVKPGMDTKQVIARFKAERQALALMDHPNIARVLAAGATESGRPYFVMELVSGVPITRYCDDAKLSREERIELFITVCEAIQHAHQKGIIHRDIKPSNILVTLHDGIPVPKVIDFGTAKALQQPLTDRTMLTSSGRYVGTPQYMSPEQADLNGLDVDTRADIYSLGVLLYELLTGTTPFEKEEFRTVGFDKMMQMIREVDPPKPSTRISTLGERAVEIASQRQVDPKALSRSLQGDLDWIVMKALEKNRQRRYETANGLAMDLRRYLDDEPVEARPPSKLYEIQKFARRHKVGFAATVGIILVLFAGIVVSTWQARMAQRARHQAEANAVEATVARVNEGWMRKRAEEEELSARRRAYDSDMNVAKFALDGNNFGRALDLLNRHRPESGQVDLRGWEWRYLWEQTRSDALYTLCTLPDEISALSVSARGDLVAVGSAHTGGVSVWDLNTRRELIRLAEQEGAVNATFSPVDPLLAFAGFTDLPHQETIHTLHFWNAESRLMIGDFPLDGACKGLVFSQDGKTLVTSTSGGSITLWSVPDGKKLASYAVWQEDPGPVTTPFAATPDLRFAAYASSGGKIQIIDLQDGTECGTLAASKDTITAIAYAPDGKTLASAAGFGEKDIRLWDVATGQEIGKLEGHGAFISSMVFWPDGSKLASSSGDQTIRIWDVATRECVDVLRGHRLEVFRVALRPERTQLFSASKDGEVCVWDTGVNHTRCARITIPGKVDAWCFEPSKKSVLTFQDGRVMQWTGKDFKQGKQVLDVDTSRYEFLGYATPRFSPDGHYLAFSCSDQTIKVWDLKRRALQADVPGYKPYGFFEDGTVLATLSLPNNVATLNAWNLSGNRKMWSWTLPRGFIGHHPIAMPPGKRQLTTISWMGDVLCANVDDGSETNLDLNVYEVGNLAYSPDGKLLAANSHLGFVKVWDAATWTEQATLRGYLVGVSSVAFSPDSKRLATGSDTREALRIWDTVSWRDTLTLEGEGAGFIHTAFSQDGNTIGSWNREGTLHLWHAPSWEELRAAEKYSRADGTDP